MKPTYALWGFLAVSHSTIIHAATLTWDQNGTAAPTPFDGGGTWTNANLFHDGTNNVTWPAGAAVTDIAAFGANPVTPYSGIPGNIAFTTAISAGGLTFLPYIGNATKYTVQGGAGGTLTLNGSGTVAVNTNWVRPFAAINGVLAGTAGVDVETSTGGILEFGTQTNTFTGNIDLKAGSSLSIANDLSLGGAGSGIRFDGTATLITRTGFTPASARPIVIANGSTAKFDSLNGQTLTVAAAIGESGGVGNLQKEGLGGLTLNTGATHTGSTSIRQGTLTLNFANVTAPVAPDTNLIPSGSTLRMFGGTLAVTGKASTPNIQTFNGLTLLPGISAVNSTAGATGGTTAVNFGAITRNPGSILNVATIAAGTSYTTSTPNTNGILGGYAAVNFADWVTAPTGTFAAFTGYQTGTDATLWAATDNVSIAATPTVALAASATINSLKVTGAADLAVPSGQTLTLSSGGVLVTNGPASISGGNLQGSAASDVVVHQHSAANAFTIGSAIIDNGGACGLTKGGAGTLILSGTNLYSGNTLLGGGTLEVSADANLGAGTTVTSRSGTTLRIAGASAFNSAKNFQFDFGSDSFGGAALGAGPNAVGNFNINVTNTAGATISGAFNVSAGTLVKSGAGTLTLTNPGENHLARLNGGLAFTMNNGTTVFDGGASSHWIVGQGEFIVGDRTTSEAIARVESGTVSAGSWAAVGRGNGTTGLQSGLIINGGIFNCGNLFTGFSDGLAGYNARPYVQVNNAAVLNISDSLRAGESAGSNASFTFSGTSQVRINNSLQVGWVGRGTVNINGDATVGTGQLWMGGDGSAGNLGAGVINQTGGSLSRQGFLGTGTNADWRIGGFVDADDVNCYGGYLISGGTFNTGNRNVQIGANGIGVMKVSGTAAVTMNSGNGGFPVVGRFTGSSGLLDVSGGTFTVDSTGQLLIIAEAGTGALNVSGTGSVLVNSNPGGAGNGGGTGGVRLGHAAGASGMLSLNGGTLDTSGIAKSSTAVTAFGYAYLNGGNLKAHSSNTTFMQGLDHALVGPGGAKIDTNGNSITISQPLIGSGTQSGVLTIPVLTAGSNYMGPPIVRITGGAGNGASAIANMAGGTVSSITVTSPGTGYVVAPTVLLLGGGTTTPATLGVPTVGTLATDGGLTQSGTGILTLGGTNTYTGTTAVTGDTVLVNGSVAGPVTVAAACSIGGSGSLGSTLTVDAAGFLEPGNFNSAGTLTVNGNTVMPGTYHVDLDGPVGDRITVNGNLDISGATLEVGQLTGGASLTSYTIASYTGSLTGSFTLGGSLPATYTLFNDVANKEIKLISNGSYGTWQGSFGLSLGTTGAPAADPDGDGIPNAVEYVTGGDPTLANSVNRPVYTLDPTNMVITFNRVDSSETPDTAVSVEASTNLAGFPVTYTVGANTGSSTPGVVVVENGGAPDTITVTIPRGSDLSKFIRVNVTITP